MVCRRYKLHEILNQVRYFVQRERERARVCVCVCVCTVQGTYEYTRNLWRVLFSLRALPTFAWTLLRGITAIPVNGLTVYLFEHSQKCSCSFLSSTIEGDLGPNIYAFPLHLVHITSLVHGTSIRTFDTQFYKYIYIYSDIYLLPACYNL